MKKIQLLVIVSVGLLHNQPCKALSDKTNSLEVQSQRIGFPLHQIIQDQNYLNSEKLAKIKTMLDQKQVDINMQDADGRTALNIVAFYKKDPELARLLLEYGADVNKPDLFNETPLHNAIAKEAIELATLFIQYGANVRFENDKGITPLDLARSLKTIQLLGLEQDSRPI